MPPCGKRVMQWDLWAPAPSTGHCRWLWPRRPPFSLASGPSARPRAPRRVTAVAARATFAEGSERDLGRAELLAPIERALRFLVGATGAAVLALVLAR